MFEDIEMAVYENDMKVNLQKEHLRSKILIRLEKDYQERCHDEFDRTHVQENEIYDLY